jgi:hypothetical protein
MTLTLYAFAGRAMEIEIQRYLRLSIASNGFTAPLAEVDIDCKEDLVMLAAGLGHPTDPPGGLDLMQMNAEIGRQLGVPFDIETSATVGVYKATRPYLDELFEEACKLTCNWTDFPAAEIKERAYLLPVLQHVGGVYSKAALKKAVGSVSDNSISGPASIRLATLLKKVVKSETIEKKSVLYAVERTLEGIVRDLVGRNLFESIVASALDIERVPYKRENEYSSISGVVYDFRADFVIPTETEPVAFIEVRKSSSRHASLYAKDKMFSAINWKGRHPHLIGILIIEGDWTAKTLRTMAGVFDYVVPLSKSPQLAGVLKKAVEGDKTILKWMIHFKVSASPLFGNHKPEG